jgi:TRAP-type C4-dicarboxylate transport system permease small subunit
MSNEAERNIFDKIIVGAFTIIIGVNSLLITLIIAGAAASRYIFKVNFYGYEEIAVLVAFWFYFMGAAYGSYNNTHVSADIIDAYLPECKMKRWLTFVRHLITCAVCGLFVCYGYEFFRFGFVGPLGNFQFKPTSMVWRIPLWTSYSAIFVGLIFMEVYFIRNLVLSVRALIGRRAEA